MEELKPLDQMGLPDERQLLFGVREGQDMSWRPLRASDIHEMAEEANLHGGVPEDVRSHFAMAQNLLAYSWHCYAFNVAAELHAYISVEFALRKRLGAPKSANFKSLLEDALKRGLIRSENFTYGRKVERRAAQEPEALPDNEVARDYAMAIAEAMRSLRNGLAHGSNTLHRQGGTILKVCSELINQLFDPPVINSSTEP